MMTTYIKVKRLEITVSASTNTILELHVQIEDTNFTIDRTA